MSHKATNWAIRQRGLRPAAKIVLWHLADRYHPDHGCFPSQGTLAHDCEMSRASLNRALADLEDAGLIRRENRTDPTTGKRLSTRYHFAFEESMSQNETRGDAMSQDDTRSMSQNEADPCLKIAQFHVSPVRHKPVIEPVREPVRGEKEPSLFSAEDGDSAIGRQPPCHAEKTDDFEEWWKTYPKSRNRPSKRLTQQKFRAALKKVSFDDLMRATRAYASECEGRDPKYVAQPTTWLNQERWEALLQAEEPVDPRVARLRHMAAGRAVY